MEDSVVETLGLLSIQLNRYVPIIQIILGGFGNIFNMLIFMRPSLQTNPCSFFFWILSINNLYLSTIHLFTRMLASGWNIDPTRSSSLLCKLRLYIGYVSSALTVWLMALASVDRYLCSSPDVRVRQRSTLSMAHKTAAIIILIMFVAHIHVLIYWSSAVIDGVSDCNTYDSTYDLVSSIFDIFMVCLLPVSFMILFGCKTILNFRHLRRTITPVNQNNRLGSKDHQMVTMLLLQVVTTLLFTLPLILANIYDTFYYNQEYFEMNPVASAIYDIFIDIARFLDYMTPVMGFYIYTLSSKTFRYEAKYILNYGVNMLMIRKF